MSRIYKLPKAESSLLAPRLVGHDVCAESRTHTLTYEIPAWNAERLLRDRFKRGLTVHVKGMDLLVVSARSARVDGGNANVTVEAVAIADALAAGDAKVAEPAKAIASPIALARPVSVASTKRRIFL